MPLWQQHHVYKQQKSESDETHGDNSKLCSLCDDYDMEQGRTLMHKLRGPDPLYISSFVYVAYARCTPWMGLCLDRTYRSDFAYKRQIAAWMSALTKSCFSKYGLYKIGSYKEALPCQSSSEGKGEEEKRHVTNTYNMGNKPT